MFVSTVTFLENSNISNYADDNTLYSSGNDLEKVKQTLRQDFEIVSKWFYENYKAFELGKMSFYVSRKEYSE